jgi:hypothetical protein
MTVKHCIHRSVRKLSVIRSKTNMKKHYLIILLAICTMAANVSKANAHDSVGFSLNIGTPYHYGPAPIYVAPPPVYYGPPPAVYYRPAPIYYGPRVSFGYHDGPGHHWHGGHRHGHGHHKHGRGRGHD